MNIMKRTLSQQFLKTFKARKSEIIRAGNYVSNAKYFINLISWGLKSLNSVITKCFEKGYCDVIKT